MANPQEEQPLPSSNHSPSSPTPQVITSTGLLPFLESATHQQSILLRVSAGTFSADKLIRLCSNLLKAVRCFALTNNLKAAEKLSMEIGQLRRLLRVDRFCLVIRDYVDAVKKEEMTGVDWFMVAFRALLVLEDCSDMLAYLIQMGVIRGRRGLLGLRQSVADCYFLECIGWLGLYSYQMIKAKGADRRKKATIVLRYLLDSIITHNDFSGRKHILDIRITTILGIFSSLLSLSLAWQ